MAGSSAGRRCGPPTPGPPTTGWWWREPIRTAPDKLARLTHRFLAQLAAEQGLAADPAVRRRLADLYLRERALELLGARIRATTRAGVGPGPVGSVAKPVKAQLTKEAAEFAFALSGPGAAAWDGADSVLADTLSRSRQASIAGGTDDIQRNIIGERLLGLPREPGVDRSVPFRDLRVGTQSG
ncbi:acyl-CoA dehydrogenase family protein [Saccharopolyspora shandongensis]|uniref:acyl-CoA dehydrogenase family protein n=1 Tax=Saccharopolyspora shandongensis TaxID=418495 RepID=UPI0033EFC583